MGILTVAMTFATHAAGASPTAHEMETAKDWVADKIDGQPPNLPFSFTYDGQSSREFLPLASQAKWTWDIDRVNAELGEGRNQRVLTYDEPRTGLQVRCEAVVYANYPAVEWVVTFQNNGDADTPIIEDVLAMDISLTRPGPGEPEYRDRWIEWKGEFERIAVRKDPGEFVMRHATGGVHSIRAFEPHEHVLDRDAHVTIGGVSSQPDLPFFNVEWPGAGMIGGIGWTAPWRGDFVRDGEHSLSVQVAMTEWIAPYRPADMRGARFLLHPGEHIRVPRVVVMFWDEDRVHAHNVWRQLLLEHYSPRRHGKRVDVPMGIGTQWHNARQNSELIEWHAEHELPIEYLWMDLGWQRVPTTDEEAREHLADDIVDEAKFPNGIQEVSDTAHKNGIKYLLWFGGSKRTRFQAIYPHLDRVRKYRPELLSDEHPGIDNGNPMINEWMIKHYGDRIADLGIDIFRWDSKGHHAPPDSSDDRRGINWARTVEGLYEFWDALLDRFPDLVIDCCGGGAVTMDLETIQRCVFMHRCDYQCGGIHEADRVFNPKGLQAQTHGISFWAPLTSGTVRQLDTYAFRSAYSPGLHATIETLVHRFYLDPPEPPSAEEFDVALYKKLMDEYMSVRQYFYGDYYPLSRYNLDEDTWMAWQFDRPDLGEGIVQVFRRAESDIVRSDYSLRGLVGDATYELTNFDLPEVTTMTGAELIDGGLSVTIPDRRAAIVLPYRKL